MARRKRKDAEDSLLIRALKWFLDVDQEDEPRPRKRPLRKRALAAAKRQGDTDLAEQIQRGEIKGDELRDLIKSGELRLRNPSGQPNLATAQRMSSQFHGKPDQVVELEPRERKLSKVQMVAGEVTGITYLPCEGSDRAETEWHHESGDRGMGEPQSSNRPLLVIDPKTKRPAVVMHKSPMRFSSKKGLVG